LAKNSIEMGCFGLGMFQLGLVNGGKCLNDVGNDGK